MAEKKGLVGRNKRFFTICRCRHHNNEKLSRIQVPPFGWIRYMKLRKVLVAQSCPTLYHPTDCNPPGFSVLGIPQARILEWVAISFSRGSSQVRDGTQVSSALQADSLLLELPGKPTMGAHALLKHEFYK